MSRRTLLTRGAVIGISILILATAIFFARHFYYFSRDVVYIDVFVAIILLISVGVGVLTYWLARSRDFLALSVARRTEFINTRGFQEIRERIEHNDILLQTVIAVLNISSQRAMEVLPEEYWKLHEKLDNYLNYLEGIALLYKQGCITKGELRGLWQYYFKRLRKIHTFSYKDYRLRSTEMMNCMHSIHDGAIPNNIMRLWEACINSGCLGIPEPIWKSKYRKTKDKVEYIDPIERPIWYYINRPPYSFDLIIDLTNYLYQDKGEAKNLSLQTDGIIE